MSEPWQVPVAPPMALASEVACSWRAEAGGTHRLVPDACVDLLWLHSGHLVVCGPEVTSWEFTLPAGTKAVGVRLRPGVAQRMLHTDLHQLTDLRIPLSDLTGDRAQRLLVDEMGASDDPLAVLERAVGDWLARSPSCSPVEAGIVHFGLQPHPPPVSEIAREVGVSTRHLHRRAERMFGYGMATLARLTRFQRFVALAHSSRGVPLSMLAATAGYHDQSHLARDCRAITRLSPSAFIAEADCTFPAASDPYDVRSVQAAERSAAVHIST